MWTEFFDMHSGGGLKTDYELILVELPEYLAIAWFKNRYEIDPEDMECTCCGPNFSISELEKMEDSYFLKREKNVLLVSRSEIEGF